MSHRHRAIAVAASGAAADFVAAGAVAARVVPFLASAKLL
jgi:hypothetical protein